MQARKHASEGIHPGFENLWKGQTVHFRVFDQNIKNCVSILRNLGFSLDNRFYFG